MRRKKGRATVLDQSVNRPSYVGRDIGKALNTFFSRHPSVSTNPGDWGITTQLTSLRYWKYMVQSERWRRLAVPAWHPQDIHHSRAVLLKGGGIEPDSISISPIFILGLDDELANVPSERGPYAPSGWRYAHLLGSAN